MAIAHLALIIGTTNGWLAAIRAANVPLVMALDCSTALPFGAVGWTFWLLMKEVVLCHRILGFCLATLPAVSPITDEELEAVGINLHTRLETDAEISEVHLVLLGVCQ